LGCGGRGEVEDEVEVEVEVEGGRRCAPQVEVENEVEVEDVNVVEVGGSAWGHKTPN